MAGAHRIAGVDSDHAGGVWIAYQEVTSSDLAITHVDASGTTLSTWTYTDDPSEVSGIAVDDTAVWVNHNAIGSIGTDGITKLDRNTGTELQTFATQGQISDLEIQWGELLLSSYQNQVIGLDRTNGGQVSWMTTQVVRSTQTGIAAYGDYLFVSSWNMDTLTLVDHDGTILGTATSPVLHTSQTAAVGRFLANDGPNKLILATESQIAWLDDAHGVM
jgi:outer membrane protein assembly factor BamB